MTAGGRRPTFAVEFSPTTGPFDPSPVWEDETSSVRAFSLFRGRQAELDAVQPGTASVELDNTDRRFDPNHATGPYYGDLLPGRRMRISATYGAEGLVCPGGTSDYASAPDAGWVPGQELELRAEVYLDDWTPAAAGLIAAQTNADFSDASIAFGVTTDGRLSLTWFETGTGTPTTVTSDPHGFSDGTTHHVRVTLDVNNGGGSYEVKFYESSDDEGSWDQIGATKTGAATGVPRNSTSPFTLGGSPAGLPLDCTILRFYLSTAIGADPAGRIRFTNGQHAAGGASSATGSYGTVWTLGGACSLPARTRRLFGGFVDGWPVPSRNLDRAPIGLTDGLGLLSSSKFGDSLPFEEAIRSLRPLHWWKLDEPTGSATVHDYGSDPVDGVPNGIAADGLGTTDSELLPGSSSSLVNDVGGYVDVGAGSSWSTMVVLFKMADRSVGISNVFRSTLFADDEAGISVQMLGWGSLGGSTGALELSDGTDSLASSGTFDDGQTHIAVIQHLGPGSFALSVDGAAQTLTSNGLAPVTSSAGRARIGYASDGPSSTITGYWNGSVGYLALFEDVLDAAAILRLLEGSAAWAGDSIDDRIATLLDLSGWSSSERDLDVSEAGSLGSSTLGSDALAELRTLESSELGAFYQEPDFTMRFRSRYATVTDPRSTRARFTFTDQPGPDRFRFEEIVIPSQEERLRNRIVVAYNGGEVTVEDADSIDAYGVREHSVDTVLETIAEARSLAELLLARYSEPVQRVESLTLNLAAEPIGWEPALELELGDRVRVVWNPGNPGAEVGDPIEVLGLVEGLELSVSQGVENATLTIWLSSADETAFWIWGESLWDSETRWAG